MTHIDFQMFLFVFDSVSHTQNYSVSKWVDNLLGVFVAGAILSALSFGQCVFPWFLKKTHTILTYHDCFVERGQYVRELKNSLRAVMNEVRCSIVRSVLWENMSLWKSIVSKRNDVSYSRLYSLRVHRSEIGQLFLGRCRAKMIASPSQKEQCLS